MTPLTPSMTFPGDTPPAGSTTPKPVEVQVYGLNKEAQTVTVFILYAWWEVGGRTGYSWRSMGETSRNVPLADAMELVADAATNDRTRRFGINIYLKPGPKPEA